jgi:hypothetical protein
MLNYVHNVRNLSNTPFKFQGLYAGQKSVEIQMIILQALLQHDVIKRPHVLSSTFSNVSLLAAVSS